MRSLATSWCLSVWSFITFRRLFDKVSHQPKCFPDESKKQPHGSASFAVVVFPRILISRFFNPDYALLHKNKSGSLRQQKIRCVALCFPLFEVNLILITPGPKLGVGTADIAHPAGRFCPFSTLPADLISSQ